MSPVYAKKRYAVNQIARSARTLNKTAPLLSRIPSYLIINLTLGRRLDKVRI